MIEIGREAGTGMKMTFYKIEQLEGIRGDHLGKLHEYGVEAKNLAARMEAVNEDRHLCQATPAPRMVAGWIDQANRMEPALFH